MEETHLFVHKNANHEIREYITRVIALIVYLSCNLAPFCINMKYKLHVTNMISMRYLCNSHHAIAFQTNNVEKYLLQDYHDVERLLRLQSADRRYKVLHGGIE